METPPRASADNVLLIDVEDLVVLIILCLFGFDDEVQE